MVKTQRSSNLELFRVFVMLLIISHHYVINSGLTQPIYENLMSNRSLFLLVFGAWGKTNKLFCADYRIFYVQETTYF